MPHFRKHLTDFEKNIEERLQVRIFFRYFGNDFEKRKFTMNKKLFFLSAIVAGMFFGTNVHAQNNSQDLVAVYRWYNPVDRDYVTVAEGEYQEGQLLGWKFKDKTLMFYAFRNPGPDRVAVYRWYNPVTHDEASIAANEFSDDDMMKMGYKKDHLQYYAPLVRGENRVAVYRWYIPKTGDWVTVPEEGDTDAYYKKDYRHKTFQYFAIKRSVDEKVYYQSL